MTTCDPFIVQIIPYDGIGGVEVAATTMVPGHYDGFRFGKAFIASKRFSIAEPGIIETGLSSENDPRAYFRLIRALIAAKPDILVLSLWRSCLVGLVIKLLRPRTKLVLFLHNVIDAHAIDALVTRITSNLVLQIWADSATTARHRLPRRSPASIKTISFLTERRSAVTTNSPAPHFISWGRLHPRKNVSAAIDFFAIMRSHYPGARFTIMGPDGGEEQQLKRKVAALSLNSCVRLCGSATHAQIVEEAAMHSFFLQTSTAEGMAMATVEAMQLGLVPIVTHVGEIASYVSDGENGVIFTDGAKAARTVRALIEDPASFATMRSAAIEYWNDHLLYRESFKNACNGIV